MGVPAVVVYGGFITPEITGYPEQIAMVDRGPGTPCGVAHGPCPHCVAALNGITAEQTTRAVETMVERINESRAPKT